MKDWQKCPVAGPTTGCCTVEAPCIDEKQSVRQPAVRYTQNNKQKMNKYIHEKTKYACWSVWLYEEREWISVRQPAVRDTQENYQTKWILVCPCMYVCMRSESESASHSSPPQLKGVWVISTCARARVCSGTIPLISLLCLPVHTVRQKKNTHTQTTLKTQANTCPEMIEIQNFHSSTAYQYSATRNTHTHCSDESPAKTPSDRADNWLLFKWSSLYRRETKS